MIFWLILIIIAILVILLFWCYNIYSHPSIYPTMHARCHKDTPCGGDLICDDSCYRCKKGVDGDCAGDVDCQTGLHCHQWKCKPNLPDNKISDLSSKEPPVLPIQPTIIPKPKKRVRWNDKNQIFNI